MLKMLHFHFPTICFIEKKKDPHMLHILSLIKKLTNINRCLTDPANQCLTDV